MNEAICGDAVGLKLSVNYRLHRGDVILLDDHIYGEATIRFAQKLSAMIHIQRWSHKEQIKDTILRPEQPFTILIRNQKTECCIRSIEWKTNVNGERIENAEYLKMGDTAQVTQ